ncbi:MAG: CBS domain-containing protein [Spongiibacteraceae bacterium]
MKKLNLYPLAPIDELACPVDLANVSLQSPALAFFTDFNLVQPLVVEASASAIKAKEMMIKSHVRLNFVVNESDFLVGVISADDLAERKLVQKVAAGLKREEIFVTDLMTPRKNLLALGVDEIKRATIADVIELLKDRYQQHCLVIDREAHKIRGVFSASDISRKLQLPIDIQEQSDFYRVFAAVS